MAILKGWRTRILSGLVFTLGALELAAPDTLSTALGLGERGHAILFIVIALTTYGLRQITSTAPGQAR